MLHSGDRLWGGAHPTPGAYINDGICLDVIHVRVPQAQLFAVSLSRAHNPCGHSVL